MKIYSIWSAIDAIPAGELLPQDSDTVPDLSLSVKDILTRFRRGTVDLDLLDRHLPDSDDDIEDDSLDGIEDLVDVQSLKNRIYEKVHGSIQCDRDGSVSDTLDSGADKQLQEDSVTE